MELEFLISVFMENEINSILANWNPIGVPSYIAIEEYRNYVPLIIEKGCDHAILYDYLQHLVGNLGLEFDLGNSEQVEELKEIAAKIANIIKREEMNDNYQL